MLYFFKKIEIFQEIFEERDKCGSGHISHEQLEDIYRVYQAKNFMFEDFPYRLLMILDSVYLKFNCTYSRLI